MSSDDIIVPTACEDWSLNADKDSEKRFWWNQTYSLSVWENNLGATKNVAKLTDTDVWKKYIEFQLNLVYKLCPICKEPEGNVDLKICCYCGATVHEECSAAADSEQIAYKAANRGFEKYLRVCFACQDIDYAKRETSSGIHKPDNARRATKRMLTLKSELPPETYRSFEQLLQSCNREHGGSSDTMNAVKSLTTNFFQSKESLRFLTKGRIATKGGGVGVIAAADIPAYTIVGVYPGYGDPLSGEQAKMGRPTPKYALMDLNCANYFNEVFIEFQDTFTPFINEPCENEVSNCAWIQEPGYGDGRLSIITVMNVKKGDELLIGYGPLYPRTYPFRYDAYAFHPYENYTDPPCFGVWHWPSKNENDATFVCYVGYVKDEKRYAYWDSQEEYEQKYGKGKK